MTKITNDLARATSRTFIKVVDKYELPREEAFDFFQKEFTL